MKRRIKIVVLHGDVLGIVKVVFVKKLNIVWV
jgi:hypothetical protein